MNASGPKSFGNCFKSIFIIPAQHKRFLFIIVLLLLFYISTGKNVKNNHFDFFVFSQRWLPSACIEYIEHNSSSSGPKHCILPKNYDIWAIHGLWPTQYKSDGPYFCNRSMLFDVKKLQSIASDLKLNWPNIEGEKDMTSLWRHEWEKHGTCAAQLESLNSEIKYFNTTLNILKMYNMQAQIEEKNILPILKNGVTVSDLLHLVKSIFGKIPQIHCIHEVRSNKPYLSEIRLCLNKNLDLMDCGITQNSRGYNNGELEALTNCPTNKKIILPEKVVNKVLFENATEMNYHDTYDKLVDILRFIWFLQWVSI